MNSRDNIEKLSDIEIGLVVGGEDSADQPYDLICPTFPWCGIPD